MVFCDVITFPEVHQSHYIFVPLFSVERGVFDPHERGGAGNYISFGIRRNSFVFSRHFSGMGILYSDFLWWSLIDFYPCSGSRTKRPFF